MNNSIQDMRDRLSERFGRASTPLKGLKLTEYRPTANNAPRLPQSTIPSPKARQDRVGRPSVETRQLPENVPLTRKKPRDIWGGWL
jgi:hypothetical protein